MYGLITVIQLTINRTCTLVINNTATKILFRYKFIQDTSRNQIFMSSTSPDIQKVVKLIQAILINRFRVSESQIYRSEQLQSDISIDNYLKLLIRHIEGILYLGSKDIFLLPPALSLARTVIETCANTLWLLNPEYPWEREIHLIALLKEEIKGYKEYIKNPNNYRYINLREGLNPHTRIYKQYQG